MLLKDLTQAKRDRVIAALTIDYNPDPIIPNYPSKADFVQSKIDAYEAKASVTNWLKEQVLAYEAEQARLNSLNSNSFQFKKGHDEKVGFDSDFQGL